MQAIELETTIGTDGNLHVPEQYRAVYGQHVRLMLLLPESAAKPQTEKGFDPMAYSNTLAWPVDGMAYQKQVRDEWD